MIGRDVDTAPPHPVVTNYSSVTSHTHSGGGLTTTDVTGREDGRRVPDDVTEAVSPGDLNFAKTPRERRDAELRRGAELRGEEWSLVSASGRRRRRKVLTEIRIPPTALEKRDEGPSVRPGGTLTSVSTSPEVLR